MNLLFIGDTNR